MCEGAEAGIPTYPSTALMSAQASPSLASTISSFLSPMVRCIWMTNVFSSLCLLQPIVYEGQDKNPEMCRVLLTHEIMCRWEPGRQS